MQTRRAASVLAVIAALTLPAFRPFVTPEAEFVAIVRAWATMGLPGDWQSLEKLPGIRWAQLPPSSLQNCAPDGGCFARQGMAQIGGRNLAVIATGARSMVFNVYFRNAGTPFGEQPILDALKAASLTATLARCPVRGGAGSTNWYRLGGAKVSPSFLSVQPASAQRNNEGFVLTAGDALPRLQPNQLALYSEQCADGVAQQPIATTMPHEQLAQLFVAMLVPVNGAGLYDWKSLAALPAGITWNAGGPKHSDLSYRNDRNAYNISGSVALAGRTFNALASGTQTQVRVIYLDESQLHPRGEHMLGVVYQKGIAVQLTRCGPVYTESTNNWYALTSAGTRPAMIRQSLRYDGSQVQDSYELRLDGTLPTRDPRDRDPGVNGCR
jgi:hypothetical protein